MSSTRYGFIEVLGETEGVRLGDTPTLGNGEVPSVGVGDVPTAGDIPTSGDGELGITEGDTVGFVVGLTVGVVIAGLGVWLTLGEAVLHATNITITASNIINSKMFLFIFYLQNLWLEYQYSIAS